MEISIGAKPSDSLIIRELLSPWNITFARHGMGDLEIVYGRKPSETQKTLIIPSEHSEFALWTKNRNIETDSTHKKSFSIEAGPNLSFDIVPEKTYLYHPSSPSSLEDSETAATELEPSLFALNVDIVKEYRRILIEVFYAKSSTIYRLLTGLPLPYSIAPKQMRDLLMKQHFQKSPSDSLVYSDLMRLDVLRLILVHAIERLSRERMPRRSWGANAEKRYACVFTHDVDTAKGLRNARSVKKLEEKYDVPSAWFVPSKAYALEKEDLRRLGNFGEIGAHDTTHDGKLIRLSKRKLIERFCEAKKELEKTAESPVEGFRAPLLQHNMEILRGLKDAGYKYDSSVPSWEPKHPRTMRAHGLGTVFPMLLNGMIEIPVTMVQDHQLLYILGMKPRDVIAYWASMIDLIKEFKGCCVLLSHPEYELLEKENLASYEEILNLVGTDKEVWVTTPNQVAEAVETKCFWN